MRLPGNRAAKTVRDEASGHPDTDGPGKHARQEGAEDAGLAPLPSDLEGWGQPRASPLSPGGFRSRPRPLAQARRIVARSGRWANGRLSTDLLIRDSDRLPDDSMCE